MKHFYRNAFVTFRGALVGQVIPIFAMPLISRLYGPETYGVFASLLALSIVLMAMTMGQMEVATVLPEDDEEAGKIARTAFQIGVMVTSALTVIMLIAQPFMHDHAGLGNLYGWSILTPLMGFFMACCLLGNFLSSRLQAYQQIGISAAVLQLANCGVTVLLGLFSPGVGGLFFGRMAGQASAAGTFRNAVKWLSAQFSTNGIASWTTMKAMLSKYQKFPLYSLPQTLLSMTSREGVPIVLVYFHEPHAAGFYALVRSILTIPVSLLSTSIGQIFYREASRGVEKADFKIFSYTLMTSIAAIVTPGCVFIALWGPSIFALAFGGDWAGAGIYAMLYMPVSLLFILSIWVARIFEVRNRQDLQLRIQIIFDTLSVGTLCTALALNDSPAVAVAAYAVCQVVYLLVYLATVFKLMNLAFTKLVRLIGIVIGMAALQLGLHEVITLIPVGLWVHFGLEMIQAGLLVLGTGYGLWRLHKDNPVMNLASHMN